MDDIDRQIERDEILHQALIAARKPEGPQPTGYCHFCEEPLDPPKRWCDAECRDAMEPINVKRY